MLITIKFFEGIASQFETQFNNKDDVQLYIKELKCKVQRVSRQTLQSTQKIKQKSQKKLLILYKQIKKKIKISIKFFYNLAKNNHQEKRSFQRSKNRR
ncbi:unnamed protein product [Paramecium octaurelia]|uniref:Uncharacterized protein n=1 Tax=Paramecium octaurelia TaxID=43137 RepID=A0A8S1WZ19_PAROT|nr:unnamed protein product [Paramecium octaurelia]